MWYKDKNVKTESASSRIEILLTSLNPTKLGVDITLLTAGCDGTLAILHQKNVWICDTSASTQVKWSNKGAKNLHDTKLHSLGHADYAMEITALIDTPKHL